MDGHKLLAAVVLLLPVILYIDAALVYNNTGNLADPWLVLRLPPSFFLIGVFYAKNKNESFTVIPCIKACGISLFASIISTVGLAMLTKFIIPQLLNTLSVSVDFSFLNLFTSIFDVWVTAGLIWPLALMSIISSFSSLFIQAVVLFASFGLLVFAPAYAGGKVRQLFIRKHDVKPIETINYTLYSEKQFKIVLNTTVESVPSTVQEDAKTASLEQISEEECETPKSLQPFHSINPEIARKKAASLGFAVLFCGYDKLDLFGRKHVYYALPQDFVVKLLRLKNDAKREDEFAKEERVILENLALKGWIKKLKGYDATYYYGLSQRTAAILQRQITITA